MCRRERCCGDLLIKTFFLSQFEAAAIFVSLYNGKWSQIVEPWIKAHLRRRKKETFVLPINNLTRLFVGNFSFFSLSLSLSVFTEI
jgi:hypothetical protein